MPGGKGGKTKHDRCVEGVMRDNPDAANPHAICVSAGVEPSSWNKVKKGDMKHDYDKDGKLNEHEKHHKKLDSKIKELSKSDLIKALDEAGQRESALLLKNWGEMDTTAELFKSKLEKNAMMGYGSSPDAASEVNATAKADECHEDDPSHEAKEKAKAKKIKSKAEELIDMHKKDK